MSPRRFPVQPRSRRPGRAVGSLLATVALLAAAAVLSAPRAGAAATADAGWSAEEQQFVYLLNQARWNPESVTAAAGLAPGTFLPQPPLAINASLAASAQSRSNDMAANHYFAHQSPISGVWPNSVARTNGYELPSWWPDDANTIESLHMGSPDPARVLQSFIESPKHRNHVMGQGWFGVHREIGVGFSSAERIWSIHTASREGADLFLTGVAYRDSNGNGGMDIGEGLGGVTITVDGRATTTTPAGGWAMAVEAGIHEVRASGGGLAGSTTVTVRVGAFNVEVDFAMGMGRSAAPRALVRAYALCQGRPPTILGTSEDDEITGTPGPDVIHGLGGDDVIYGLGGDDVICGGTGDDLLSGDGGKDLLIGGAGRDHLVGGDGDDVMRGQAGQDTVSGGPGHNVTVLR
jgi:uncharacterized protein YkwD